MSPLGCRSVFADASLCLVVFLPPCLFGWVASGFCLLALARLWALRFTMSISVSVSVSNTVCCLSLSCAWNEQEQLHAGTTRDFRILTVALQTPRRRSGAQHAPDQEGGSREDKRRTPRSGTLLVASTTRAWSSRRGPGIESDGWERVRSVSRVEVFHVTSESCLVSADCFDLTFERYRRISYWLDRVCQNGRDLTLGGPCGGSRPTRFDRLGPLCGWTEIVVPFVSPLQRPSTSCAFFFPNGEERFALSHGALFRQQQDGTHI